MSRYRKTEGDLIRQLWRETRRTEDGCWEWMLSTDGSGYGQVGARVLTESEGSFRPLRVHRLAWLLLVGEIPDGMELHHKCENKICCNPDHLELLDHREHVHRHYDPDYCIRGHAFTPENTGYKRGSGRICKACDRERAARRRMAKSDPCVWCGKLAHRDPRRRSDKPAECRACFHEHAVPNPNGPGKVSYFSRAAVLS